MGKGKKKNREEEGKGDKEGKWEGKGKRKGKEGERKGKEDGLLWVVEGHLLVFSEGVPLITTRGFRTVSGLVGYCGLLWVIVGC